MNASTDRFLQRLLIFCGILALGGAWWFGWGHNWANNLELARTDGPLTSEPSGAEAIAVTYLISSIVIFLALVACVLFSIAIHLAGPPDTTHARAAKSPLWDRFKILNQPASWTGFIAIYLLYLAALVGSGSLGIELSAWLSPNKTVGYPAPDTPTSEHAWAMLLMTPTAGPTEELVFAAAIPLLARALTRRPGWALALALAISVSLRIQFHLYYGWAYCIAIAAWAIVAVVLWWFTGQLLALVAAHAAHNFIVTCNGYEGLLPFNADVPFVVLVLLPLVALIALVVATAKGPSKLGDFLRHGPGEHTTV